MQNVNKELETYKQKELEKQRQEHVNELKKDIEEEQKEEQQRKQKVSNDAKKLLTDNKQNDEEKMEQARKMLSFKNYHWQKAKNEISSNILLTKDRLKRDALKFIKEVRTDRLASDAEGV